MWHELLLSCLDYIPLMLRVTVLAMLTTVAFAFFNYCVGVRHFLYEVVYQVYYYILGGSALFEDYVYRQRNKINVVSRAGEVAVVTGGSRGLGLEVTKHLLKCDMHVIIGCRDVEAGEKTVEKFRKAGVESGSAAVLPLDLASLKSVSTFATLVQSKYHQIHCLVNNAGIMFVPYKLTEDGFESHLGVNYLGHCLLTHLLLPQLKAAGHVKGSNSRIVNVSSCAYLAGAIHFEDLMMKDMYIASAAYAQSKLAQILFTNSLEKLLRLEAAPVQVHSVHPGIVNTDLFNGTFFKSVVPWLPYLLFKTPQQGAASILYACMAPSLGGHGGTYISNCQVTDTSHKTKCEITQNKLWDEMLNMIKVHYFGVSKNNEEED